MADIHARSFGRAWARTDFEGFLDPTGFGMVAEARIDKGLRGFILTRIIADEAEVLSFAVDPDWRACGVGKMLLTSLILSLKMSDRAGSIVLEVAEDNHVALGLYERARFEQVGIRPDYYGTLNGDRARGLILRRELNRPIE